MYVKFLTQTVT